MNHAFTFLALDLAEQRSREAAAARLAQEAEHARPPRPGVVRAALAIALAGVAQGAVGAVRRLDACTAEELTARLVRAAR